MMSTWHDGCSYNGLHSSWKRIVLTKLQLNCNELHHTYGGLQPCNSCNLSISIHNV
jgi:hypothetical protein